MKFYNDEDIKIDVPESIVLEAYEITLASESRLRYEKSV